MWDWDERKRAANLAKHGVDFTEIDRFDWTTAQGHIDDRRDYGEIRIVTLGFIDGRLHVLTWALRSPVNRIINLRKANVREQRDYIIARAAH